MYLALNPKTNQKIKITDAIRKEAYTCLCSGSPILVKEDKIRVKHFSHKPGADCPSIDGSKMSEWHWQWQELFHTDLREIIIKDPASGQMRRADVLIGNTVIEFQNSPISAEEFDARNEFYTKLGYQVIWMFNMLEPVECRRIRHHFIP